MPDPVVSGLIFLLWHLGESVRSSLTIKGWNRRARKEIKGMLGDQERENKSVLPILISSERGLIFLGSRILSYHLQQYLRRMVTGVGGFMRFCYSPDWENRAG